MSTTSEQIVKNQHFSLLELLDRLLDKGVVVKGEILLSVADIDLVYLNLGILLSSVKTVQKARLQGADTPGLGVETVPQDLSSPHPGREAEPPCTLQNDQGEREETCTESRLPARSFYDDKSQAMMPRAAIDPKNVEQGLAKLVLTLVDLIRKLMEKQAVRRIEDGQLLNSEIERMGNTFFLLDEKIEQLKEVFGLKGQELNLDLGPLGELI